MADLQRCSACHGVKRVRGMGGIERDCTDCGGTGWIKSVADEPISEPVASSADDPLFKKPIAAPKRAKPKSKPKSKSK